MVLVQGNNGHGKSNLLEALYLLVIAKSQRASTERELVRRESVGVEFFSQVAAVVQREDGPVRVQVDFKNTVNESHGGDAENRLNVQKYVRVNGIPRRASELVGEINAVMFSAQDLDMVYGSPGLRRRYMDILISQVDREYLRAVQRYQRVVVQRNHLLKGIKASHSRPSDLEFWDGELVKSGSIVVARRRDALDALSQGAAQTHATLTDDGDAFELAYRPSFDIDGRRTPEDIGLVMQESLMQVRSREIAQGFSVRGPIAMTSNSCSTAWTSPSTHRVDRREPPSSPSNSRRQSTSVTRETGSLSCSSTTFSRNSTRPDATLSWSESPTTARSSSPPPTWTSSSRSTSHG